ncbi:hypothetical protein [Deinococcus marmoris]|uniref:Uncharacterized protein n=1 Tax=Deinococcus marmoris TaxID=249408 RepID=A0A1U7P4P8_9DEIO|nr:hypothetical protein [Deinococcus marmoris]OLV20147.1 hypothetical protein BOO71_0000469 [Deinococcus marmoris]
MKDRVPTGINQFVYVRLTRRGVVVLRKHEAAQRDLLPQSMKTDYVFQQPDLDGQMSWPLWQFMAIFGPAQYNGADTCFEVIQIEVHP